MAKKGFVKLPRRLFEDDTCSHLHVFSELEATVYIYASADKNATLQTSLRSLASTFMWDKMKLSRFLNRMQRKGYIMVNSDSKNTTINIVDFGSSVSSDTQARQQAHQKRDTKTPINKGIDKGERDSSNVSSDTQARQSSRVNKNIDNISSHNLNNNKNLRNINSCEFNTHAHTCEEFLEFLKNECPYIYKHYNLPTLTQLIKLTDKYGLEAVKDETLNIENRLDLRKKYCNLYLTLNNWLKRDFRFNENAHGTKATTIGNGSSLADAAKRERANDAANIVAELIREEQGDY